MTWPMILTLSEIDADRAIGTYTIGGEPDKLPDRALFLEPEAAASFEEELMSWAVVSDMFRSPESSLAAMRSGRGAKAPGFSGHNYGRSIDLDLRASWQNFSAYPGTGLNKRKLDEWLAARGWFCHRVDHQVTTLKGESHHYNFLGVGTVISPRVKSTSGYIEAWIQACYGQWFELEPKEVQLALSELRMYSGAVDGLIGPLSKEAIRAFQRAWGLSDTARVDGRTARTLAYVTADRTLV